MKHVMKQIYFIVFLIPLVILVGCSESKGVKAINSASVSSPSVHPTLKESIPSSSTESKVDSPTEMSETEMPETEMPVSETIPPLIGKVEEDEYYSIKVNNTLIQLRNDEKTVQSILGKPLKVTQPKQLGEGADTFSEMYSKTLYYEGLSLRFLGMTEDDLWLAEIVLNKNKYETSEGIKVGDTLNALINSYPNIKYSATTVIEDKPNSQVYEFFQDSLGFFAEFIIDENEKIEEMHMYFLFD